MKIPAGVDTGARLRLAGEGEHGRRGGPAGDLYVVLQVAAARALPSATASTSSRSSTISYPAGGARRRASRWRRCTARRRWRSRPAPRTAATSACAARASSAWTAAASGDHVVTVEVEVPNPRDLSEEETQLLRRLAELGGAAGASEERGVFDRGKKNLFG